MLLDNNADLYMDIGDLYLSTYHDIMGTDVWDLDVEKAKKIGTNAKRAGTSYYGLCDVGEFVSEAVAEYFCSDNPSDLTKTIVKKLIEGK